MIKDSITPSKTPDLRRIELAWAKQGSDGSAQQFCSNRVVTSKYTKWNFIPVNLIEQFKKASNVYFLVIMFLQMIPMISISGGNPAMLPPLVFVITLSMIKDAYEDYQRHSKDDDENNLKCQVVQQDKRYEQSSWEDIRVGQILKINQDEYVPADLLLVSNTGTDGMCFVETKNLDGETNLKIKHAPKEINHYFSQTEQLPALAKSVLVCEQPTKELYKFNGQLQLPTELGKSTIPLTNENVLLRGMTLRNTEYIYGLVIYCGP